MSIRTVSTPISKKYPSVRTMLLERGEVEVLEDVAAKCGYNQGYYAAIAALIRKTGEVDYEIREIFFEGGEPYNAAPEDLETFKQHKLI